MQVLDGSRTEYSAAAQQELGRTSGIGIAQVVAA